MRALALLALALPAPLAAQTLPPLCRVVSECFGTRCEAHRYNVAMAFTPLEGGAVQLTDATNPAQTIRLDPVPGEGTPSWVGRSLRTRGTVLLSLGPDSRAAVSIHNDAEADLTLVFHMDCTPAAPEAPAAPPLLSKQAP